MELRKKYQALICGIDRWREQKRLLAARQQAYLAADGESTRLLQEYEVKNRAFLNEQAGIIAAALTEGTPCPVCGSTVHPQLAALSEDAPTAADVRKAKREYDRAQ